MNTKQVISYILVNRIDLNRLDFDCVNETYSMRYFILYLVLVLVVVVVVVVVCVCVKKKCQTN